jgi:hypothetical protein
MQQIAEYRVHGEAGVCTSVYQRCLLCRAVDMSEARALRFTRMRNGCQIAANGQATGPVDGVGSASDFR